MDKDKMIAAYQRAVNKIDDYFEYDSMIEKKTFQSSRAKVHSILEQLTKELTQAK